jgi:hypothetical protein
MDSIFDFRGILTRTDLYAERMDLPSYFLLCYDLLRFFLRLRPLCDPALHAMYAKPMRGLSAIYGANWVIPPNLVMLLYFVSFEEYSVTPFTH